MTAVEEKLAQEINVNNNLPKITEEEARDTIAKIKDLQDKYRRLYFFVVVFIVVGFCVYIYIIHKNLIQLPTLNKTPPLSI